MPAVIEVQNLHKSYGDTVAVDDVSFTVEEGDVSCVQNRQVHWVDAEGAAARAELARRAGWGGVSLWALGYEDDEVWQALIAATRNPLDAEPTGG